MAIELGSAKPDVQALYDLKPGHTGLRLPETLVRAQAMTQHLTQVSLVLKTWLMALTSFLSLSHFHPVGIMMFFFTNRSRNLRQARVVSYN